MRLVIIKDDNTVIVDGERHQVDCTALPAAFHALQWDGNSGEVEHQATRCEHCGARTKKGNETISDLSPYQPYVDEWKRVKATADEAAAKVLFAATQETGAADAAGPQG